MPDRTHRLLIVDDSPEDRELLRRLMARAGDRPYGILEAETVAEGLAACAAHAPHCVLLDFHLPDGDGLEFLARLRRVRDRPPVVVLTGQGNEQVAVAAMKAGAKDYLPKGGVTSGALNRAVGNAVEKGLLEARLGAQRRLLKSANHDLARRNREIQTFYHVVSHELKTPLTVVREFTAILLDGLSGPVSDEQRDHLGVVRDNCDQMTAMINDLVDVSRLEHGKLAIHPEAFDLGALAAGVVHAMAPIAASRGVALLCSPAPALPPVHADPARIRQVLHNLVVNALKFTPAGGRVVLAVAPGPLGGLAVTVSDTGVGIPPDQAGRIFERFYQVGGDALDHPGGLGLGLTLCRGLVGLHGGELTVESVPGRGSVFRFTLSAAAPVPQGADPCTRS